MEIRREGAKGLVWRLCNGMESEGWPDVWKEGLVVLIAKKDEGERVEDYKGVTLMPTLYKVYASALAERVRKETEEKRIIPHNQIGFRKGMGTMDNIHVLNCIINKQLGKKEGKLIALFINLKAAFDTVNRGVLIETMRKEGIREGLVKRTEEM